MAYKPTNSPIHAWITVAIESIVAGVHFHLAVLTGTTKNVTASGSISPRRGGKEFTAKVLGQGTPDTVRDGAIALLEKLARWIASDDRTKVPGGRPSEDGKAAARVILAETLKKLGVTDADWNRECLLLIAASKPQPQTLVKCVLTLKSAVGAGTYTLKGFVRAADLHAGLLKSDIDVALSLRVDSKDVKAVVATNAENAKVADEAAKAAESLPLASNQ